MNIEEMKNILDKNIIELEKLKNNINNDLNVFL